MPPDVIIRRRGTGKYKLTLLFPLVNLTPRIIPYLRILLPLIKQTWDCSGKNAPRINFHLYAHLYIGVKPYNAGSYLFRGFGLAAAPDALDQYRAGTLQTFRQRIVGKSIMVSHNRFLAFQGKYISQHPLKYEGIIR
jgi:hypothetical protein